MASRPAAYQTSLPASLPLVIQTGHTNVVAAVAFDPANPMRLATGGQDRLAKIWDLRTAKESMALAGHTDAVQAVAFSPDGTRLATGSGGIAPDSDNAIRIWDLVSGTTLRTIPTTPESSGGVNGLVFDQDGEDRKSTRLNSSHGYI